MQGIRTERRWVALVLVVLFLMVVSESFPQPNESVARPEHASLLLLDPDGGRRPPALKECALAVGLFVGGIVGMGVNPRMGAACISWGFHIGLVTCV